MIRTALIVLHAAIGISAIGAGQALVRDPSGRVLSFETAWLKHSPFPDYRVPGLFLALVLGSSNLLSARLQLRRSRKAPAASFMSGLLLLAWLGIQTIIIGVRHPSQLVWPIIFGLTTVISLHQLRTLRSDA